MWSKFTVRKLALSFADYLPISFIIAPEVIIGLCLWAYMVALISSRMALTTHNIACRMYL